MIDFGFWIWDLGFVGTNHPMIDLGLWISDFGFVRKTVVRFGISQEIGQLFALEFILGPVHYDGSQKLLGWEIVLDP